MPSMISNRFALTAGKQPSGSPSPAKALGLFTPVNGTKVTQLPPDIIPSDYIIIVTALVEQNPP
ncbi:hypothetical protein [Bradyrhizobium sp. S69]|uniref:hypothetical protein n=1 Tax=Bradyrhizobium sp. S69 TaxID=1641856 RepID=UPI00131B1F19|nr:hypothetical protein [Bradyrhizobium sp. S69]